MIYVYFSNFDSIQPKKQHITNTRKSDFINGKADVVAAVIVVFIPLSFRLACA